MDDGLVAIAYVMHKARFVFPIIGGRKVEHLEANLEALDISLTDEQLKFIDSTLPFDLGFPTAPEFGIVSLGLFHLVPMLTLLISLSGRWKFVWMGPHFALWPCRLLANC